MKNGHIRKTEKLIKKALEIGASELEYVICQAELSVQKQKDKILHYD